MSPLLNQDERENLQSLKKDLVNPVKSFLSEVGEDTVGDAKRFYAAKARKAEESARRAKEKTQRQMAAIRREQEEMKKQRKATAKRAAIVLILLGLFSLIVISAALCARAEEPDPIALGQACLAQTPPDYENAALYFRRAARDGDAEGYYRLAGMYEQGLLTVGNPCTDDLAALGAAEAEKYYALAAQGGCGPAQEKRADAYSSILQDEAVRMLREEQDAVLLDVRRVDEFDEGHIPGALCIPVESITAPPEALSDFEQTILIYCRSGRRSKQAAGLLAAMGYTHVYEFGGILDWTGPVVTAEEDTPFLALTGLNRMAGALNAGAAIVKVYYTDGYGFSVSEFTTIDADEMQALWDAVRKIRLGGPSHMGITDWYPQIIFYLSDGQRFGVRFEGQWLDKGENYELENAEDFWALTKALTARNGK